MDSLWTTSWRLLNLRHFFFFFSDPGREVRGLRSQPRARPGRCLADEPDARGAAAGPYQQVRKPKPTVNAIDFEYLLCKFVSGFLLITHAP